MQKMIIEFDHLDTSTVVRGLNDDRAYSRAGIVSYQCKVYRAQLDQGRVRRSFAQYEALHEQRRESVQA